MCLKLARSIRYHIHREIISKIHRRLKIQYIVYLNYLLKGWKMKYLLIIAILISFKAFGLSSPFVSTIPGLDIPNAHLIYQKDGVIVRSMAPRNDSDYKQLLEQKFTDVLIFKHQTRKEVDKEIKKLLELGFKKEQIHHIPFKWHGFASFEGPCKQSIQALKLMVETANKKGRKMLLHCTVGEDRTGYIAGLFKLMLEKSKTQDIFKNEMCFNGFGAGNPKKPLSKVVLPIRESLTPLFLKMAYKFELGYLGINKLDENNV